MDKPPLENVIELVQKGKHEEARKIARSDHFKEEVGNDMRDFQKKNIPKDEKLLRRHQHSEETKSMAQSYVSQNKRRKDLDKKDYKMKIGLTSFVLAILRSLCSDVGSTSERGEDPNSCIGNPEQTTSDFIQMIDGVAAGRSDSLSELFPILVPTWVYWNTIRKGGESRGCYLQCRAYGFVPCSWKRNCAPN